MPAAIMPLSPWVELEAVDETFTTNTRDLIATRDVVIGSGDVFVGPDGDRRDPLAAPIYADLAGLPPTFMQAGGCENFVATSRTLLANAQAVGVEARLEVVEEMQHDFQLMAGASRDADDAIARLAQWVRPQLGLG
jgi:monoterpene epsilon-lactone hydrolase